ncbi:type I polyketide synthase [Tautonia plasticadhaerens]|uniref:Phenolphthiocerol synthesis polyketide synthase type I Pks15/1 n=1 Tax=Tautonia plasticadhaerens TaxID=2527974 RepID=A0A518H0K3_9BACT|nr:type I polyketide synthase [Tautonia plasticadhaerens]QDV34369.1 Phenolphthiocerol synthesis polyketide synthase type I Pks15/1 [Tautonia plasticadhaerens]
MIGSCPRVLVLAPGGPGGIAALVAGGRAGALGLLDLTWADDGEVREALEQAGRWADRPFGVVLPPGGMAAGAWPDRLAAVVCRGGPGTDWRAAVGRVSARGRVALAEVTDRQSALAATAAGAAGVIVSGLEAGGRCGEESSLVLLQAVLGEGVARAWVRGGIGPGSAAAVVAMGAAGVVLDGALLLAKESPLAEADRDRVARLDGGETAMIGPDGGPRVRVDAPPGSNAVARLREAAAIGGEAWARAEAALVGWGPGRARPLGQDAAFAARLAGRFRTVGGIVGAVEGAIDEGIRLASTLRPLAKGSPMAEALGTRYPIVQGPMTRVSDTAAFALAVADGGALPMLALAMLKGPEAASLLSEAAEILRGKPWGVGLLGFADPEIRAGQLEAVRESRPPFALIAGGRPDQAKDLERLGIRTFLHAPSPGLLNQYLRDGARRFVLEGRECGGHVGPRSSLVLWEQAAAEIRSAIDSGVVADPGSLHLLFAGGVHDARSAAGVAALASPMAGLGVKVGVLVGTAYLFAKEAVDSGAIAPRFQREALSCRETVLLPTGPGHEVRAVPSPFTGHFEAERRRLIEAGAPAEEVRETLERLNVGRLRVASKGMDRDGKDFRPLAEEEQYGRGLYMIGQVATLRDRVTTIDELHENICSGASALLEQTLVGDPSADSQRPSDVAIVGMSGIFPGAADIRSFWENTLKGVDAIVEIPPDRWDWRPYYDPDPKAPDKVVSKWGGFLPDVPFDPLRYGMPPSSLPSIEPAQLLVLEAVRAALDDAGYADRPFPRERTAVVLGMGGGAAQLAMGYAFRSYLPMLESVAPEAGKAAREAAEPLLPSWTEDAFPGFLLNVTAGRVANRFDLGGANYTVDAACGSSLAAASLAVRELETGAADVVILGGADTVQNPFTYLAFSKTHAFSPRGRCRPFDSSADGIVISEGMGVLILKRLADAERDGDRIYAVIKGLGSSSDGRARGLTAPNGEGQSRALRRAYDKAGVPPASVGYVEAHGTGTAVGDEVEVGALAGFLREHGAAPGSCVVGSVKSMIGHTKCAAGLAGLINASLALYHRALPPTIGVERPNPAFDLRDGPVRVGTKARPWLHASGGPRRAGVSAFGFGGTNFHAVLESYEGDPSPRPDPQHEWPAELFVWRDEDREAILGRVDRLIASIGEGARPRPRDLAHALALRFDPEAVDRPTLAIVAGSVEELRERMETARGAIARGDETFDDRRGVHFSNKPAFAGGGVALLFPGQGAQRPEMLGDLTLAFEEVRLGFEAFDAALIASGGRPIGPMVFPPTTLNDRGRDRARHELTATEAAQPAVGAASVGMWNLLEALGVEASAFAGHSYGELVALCAAGAMDVDALARLSEARGRLMARAAGPEPGAMAALLCDADRAAAILSGIDGVVVANLNGPRQTVISGDRDALNRAIDRARGKGIRAFDLPVGGAFHAPVVSGAIGPMVDRAREAIARPPASPVFSNLDAAPHPDDPAEIARRLGDHLASLVRFDRMIESMYDSGVRSFIECGPGSTLSPLVRSILGDRPHLVAPTDAPGRGGIPTLLSALARLLSGGVPVRRLARLTGRRGSHRVDPERPEDEVPAPPPSTWLVNGSRARPISGPEPRRLGMALPGPPPGEASGDASHRHGNNGANGHRASVPGAPDLPRSGAEDEKGLVNGDGRMPGPRGVSADGVVDGGRTGPREGTVRGRFDVTRETNGSGRPGITAAERNGHAARHPSPTPPIGTGTGAGESARVMEAFQETMRAFLEVQRSTMLAYLSGRPPADAPAESLDPGVPDAPRAGDPQGAGWEPDAGRHRPEGELMGDEAVGPANYPPPPRTVPRPGGGDRPLLDPTGPGPEGDPPGDEPGASGRVDESTGVQSSPPPDPADRPGGSVADRLVAIVRDRTGYPAEMLGMGLDLEADLGIDSIKRIEILGSLRDAIDGMAEAGGSGLMDQLARSKTLGEIVSRVESALTCPGEAPPDRDRGVIPGEGGPGRDRETGRDPGDTARADGPARPPRRMVLEAVDAPARREGAGLAPGGIVVVTDDGRGVAGEVAGRLRGAGLSVEVAGPGWADPASPSAVAEWLGGVKGGSPVSGIIHAQPLGDPGPAGLDPSRWSGRLDPSLRGLFHLARAAAEDLERSSREGGSCLIAATAMGGGFASVGGADADFFPGDGGVAGLVKTLAREWPGVRARVVDLRPSDPPPLLADRLADEAMTDDDWPEVGYLGGRRIRLGATDRPIPGDRPGVEVGEGEPILITGGARGIGAAVAAELARRWRPTLLLIGSSPMPPDREGPETAGLATAAELKRALLEASRRGGGRLAPRELDRSCRRLLVDREIRGAIRRIREAGAVAEYASVDVRDAGALAEALASWKRRFGDPVGLIHGAGVIHDKLLRDKTSRSFDAVLGTKVDGAMNLARLLRGDVLRFSALFSSIAGRFGNQGQSDYAAANEVLNKLAVWLDRRWPGRVVSLNWGPWSGVGMVSELEGHLGRRGLGMIDPASGSRALVDELRFGRKGEVEVILAGALGGLDGPLPARGVAAAAGVGR